MTMLNAVQKPEITGSHGDEKANKLISFFPRVKKSAPKIVDI
jgi:hypothetical protein